mgnify:CR=1 FL=1
MTTFITFSLNGQKYKLFEKITLSDLINYFNYTEEIFVIEYNNIICHQKNWNKVKLSENDNIEIITIVGGG